ncbi:MAG: hypothetical protein JNK21_00320 [Rhodospirillaceae bacterium]|nr:hypothetical protein [Rhodospirillaceae bacterium]
MNKAFMLTMFRSLVFGLCAFVLISLSRIKISSAWDVAGFVLGATVLWYLIEVVVLKALLKKKPPPPRG